MSNPAELVPPWRNDKVLLARRGDRRPAFRLVKSDRPVAEQLVSDLCADRVPRGPQERNALIHNGISMFLSAEAAIRRNDDFRGRLGDTLATLTLDPDLGIWWASTLSRSHITVWGRAKALEASITDLTPFAA